MTVKQEVQKLEPSSLVELFHLAGEALGDDEMYFHANTVFGSIWWRGTEYKPWPVKVEGFERTSEKPPNPKLTVANLEGTISQLCLDFDDMVGCKVTKTRTFGKFLDAINFGKNNLLIWSEAIDNAVWQHSGSVSITSNALLAPDGETTADEITIGAANQFIYQEVNVESDMHYSLSTHVRLGTLNQSGFKIAVYDVTNSVWLEEGISSSSVSSSSWSREEVTFKTSVDCVLVRVYIYRNNVTLDTGTLYLWGAQLERGLMATDYQPKDLIGRNPEADPEEEFTPEIWFIDRKSGESNDYVQFELASAFDLNGVKLPRRQIIANYCSSKSIGGYRGVYCGYTGPAVAKADGSPTSSMLEDDCGGKLSDCKLREWPDDVLNFGGYPAAALMRT